MARFKVAKGKLMVIPPGEKPKDIPVHLIYDDANNAFGIQVIDGSQLHGYVFFVSQAALRDTRDKGTEMDKLKSV
jgi:hypothetical protein